MSDNSLQIINMEKMNEEEGIENIYQVYLQNNKYPILRKNFIKIFEKFENISNLYESNNNENKIKFTMVDFFRFNISQRISAFESLNFILHHLIIFEEKLIVHYLTILFCLFTLLVLYFKILLKNNNVLIYNINKINLKGVVGKELINDIYSNLKGLIPEIINFSYNCFIPTLANKVPKLKIKCKFILFEIQFF